MAWVTVDDVEKAFDKWIADWNCDEAQRSECWHAFMSCLLPYAVEREMNTTVYALRPEHVNKGDQ